MSQPLALLLKFIFTVFMVLIGFPLFGYLLIGILGFIPALYPLLTPFTLFIDQSIFGFFHNTFMSLFILFVPFLIMQKMMWVRMLNFIWYSLFLLLVILYFVKFSITLLPAILIFGYFVFDIWYLFKYKRNWIYAISGLSIYDKHSDKLATEGQMLMRLFIQFFVPIGFVWLLFALVGAGLFPTDNMGMVQYVSARFYAFSSIILAFPYLFFGTGMLHDIFSDTRVVAHSNRLFKYSVFLNVIAAIATLFLFIFSISITRWIAYSLYF